MGATGRGPVVKLRLSFVVVLAACGFVLVPAAGLAGQSGSHGWQQLIKITGNGHKDSSTFHIPSKSIQVAYSYGHCQPKVGNLFVDLVSRRGVTREVVAVQGAGGKKRVWAYPKPGTYHLSISSVCRWYVAVYGH
jgi:hypothetical protein